MKLKHASDELELIEEVNSYGTAAVLPKTVESTPNGDLIYNIILTDDDETESMLNRSMKPATEKPTQSTLSLRDGEPFEDALKYSETGVMYAVRGRTPALFITFAVELIPAFVVATGATSLRDKLTVQQANVMIGFLTVISAISGNVGLQSSSLVIRALSHDFTNKSNVFSTYMKELLTALMIGQIMGLALAFTAFIWIASFRVSLIIYLAQSVAIFVASLTGSLSPIIFHAVLKKDPGMWAGPLETAIQDIIGASVMFFGGIAILDILPSSWS